MTFSGSCLVSEQRSRPATPDGIHSGDWAKCFFGGHVQVVFHILRIAISAACRYFGISVEVWPRLQLYVDYASKEVQVLALD